jgi:hypothetical protein
MAYFKFPKFDAKDVESSKKFLIFLIFNGICLNFIFFSVFNFPFNFYSWIGYGLIIWFVEIKLIKLLRALWFR